MTSVIPLANIIAMVVVLLVSVALPTVACLVVRKITKASFMSLLVGMAAFFVCFIIAIASQMLFSLFIGSQTLLILVLALRAGVVEELGRFLAFKVFLRKKHVLGDALMYGVGHGGMEVLLVLTLGMVSNLAFVFMVNAGMLDMLVAAAPEQAAALGSAVDTLANSSPLLFGMGLFERVSAMILHVSLSVIVFCAVRQRKPLYLVLAILMHTIADSSLLLLVNGWVSTELFELIIFVIAAICALIAWTFARRFVRLAAQATSQVAPEPLQ
jgi:uncharacterized membrane protein YhfC